MPFEDLALKTFLATTRVRCTRDPLMKVYLWSGFTKLCHYGTRQKTFDALFILLTSDKNKIKMSTIGS